MEIYLDILILENLVINYFILVLTTKFIKINISNIKIFMGALVGALYVLILIFFPDIKIYYGLISKFILSCFIVLVTFSPQSIKEFLKVLATFYISTFMVAGAAFAFIYFNNSGSFIRSGILYMFWDSKISFIFWAMISLCIVLRLFWDVFQNRFKDRKLISVKIVFEQNKVVIPALVDTGSFLKDPLSNFPVIVVEFLAIKEILPIEIRNIFNEIEEDLFEITKKISISRWFNRFRIIPFSSLGKQNGILLGFKPDYIEIKEHDRNINDVIVGISRTSVSSTGAYKAIMNPELI